MLEEEADSDRGRVLFSAPFRRLQNKAQVFSLETNASVRSRLTHSLEVSSIGRYIAQQAIKAFSDKDKRSYGVLNNERPLITFVETACLLHDIGNPPFGHFGEIAISEWFDSHDDELRPEGIKGPVLALWNRYFADFRHFDGNPQGLRIITKLQTAQSQDLNGLNLAATTIAATIKYPWASDSIGDKVYPWSEKKRKKCGFFQTECDVVKWVRETMDVPKETRHPLAYLMEAADDIAYCVSDIEDGIEKGLATPWYFGEFLEKRLNDCGFREIGLDDREKRDIKLIFEALQVLRDMASNTPKDGGTKRLAPMQDLRSATIRLLARRAGKSFAENQKSILAGTHGPLLDKDSAFPILDGLKSFAEFALYSSPIVRNREITAHAVLTGLLEAFLKIMKCDKARFDSILAGAYSDGKSTLITRDRSLAARLAGKYRSVYMAAVELEQRTRTDGHLLVMERIHRLRLIVDHISSMTDEYALQTHHLLSGTHITPYRT